MCVHWLSSWLAVVLTEACTDCPMGCSTLSHWVKPVLTETCTDCTTGMQLFWHKHALTVPFVCSCSERNMHWLSHWDVAVDRNLHWLSHWHTAVLTEIRTDCPIGTQQFQQKHVLTVQLECSCSNRNMHWLSHKNAAVLTKTCTDCPTGMQLF